MPRNRKTEAPAKPPRRCGAEGFEEHYRSLYGSRWHGLRQALLAAPHQVALSEGLTRPYYLDDASLQAARQLPLHNGDRVVDLCAAPGGKSLALALRLPPDATLVCNERSAARRGRLHRVLQSHLPDHLLARVSVTGHDATRWGVVRPQSCERILLDVPCSSERHVLGDEKHLATWSSTRSARLALQAFAMLAAAIDALVAGGHVLYITCALSPQENDAVIARAFGKRRGRVEQCELQLPWGDPTRHGVHVLPDSADGRGPLYVSLLRKREVPEGDG